MRFHALRMAMLALPLAGCALLGGGGDPADLYRFGTVQPASQAAEAPMTTPVTILYQGARFERQSSGNRIVTETGNQVAYVADARWIAPATELFDSAAVRQLETLSPSIRVTRPGQRPLPDYVLEIEVRRFAAAYPGGAGTAPEGVVETRARLMQLANRSIVGDWPVARSEPAGENRVGAIVASLDRATQAVVSQIAALASQAVAEAPRTTPVN